MRAGRRGDVALKRLLDTNAYSALKRGHPDVAQLVRESETLFFSVVVLGELLFGFRNGSRYQQNVSELRQMLEHPAVRLVGSTQVTADRYARISAALRQQGTPIPSNDIWIAAHAMETGAELISLDSHFEKVAGLALIRLDQLPAHEPM